VPRDRSPRRLEALLRRSFGAVTALVLVLVALSSLIYFLEVFRFEPELKLAVAVSRTVRSAHQGMLDQETGIRGYLLSGGGGGGPDRSDLLGTYQQGRREYVDNMAQARATLGSRGQLGRLLAETDSRAQSWMTQ